MEKATTEKEAHGEFESECPDYCGAQDTFYVGNFIRIQTSVSPSHTQGWSRVRESRLHGSGRGAVRNDRPLYVANVWHDHFCRMARKAVSLRCPFGDQARAVNWPRFSKLRCLDWTVSWDAFGRRSCVQG